MKNSKRIYENEEQVQEPKQSKINSEDIQDGVTKLSQMINKPYSEFIQELTAQTPPSEGEVVAPVDSKVVAVLNLGKKDLNLKDEIVPVDDKSNLPVKSLFPTQSQIGLFDSIGFLAFIYPDRVENPLNGVANFGGERILTANKKYILDGHHRWSQTYIINPDASIPCLNLSLNVKSEKDMLKVIQMAIASTYGSIVMKSANAKTDIYNPSILKKWNEEYKITGDTTLGLIKAVLDGKFGVPEDKKNGVKGDIKNVEKFVDLIAKSKNLKDRSDVEKYLAKNADELIKNNGKPADAPMRAIMPQPGDTADATGKKEGEKIAGIPKDFVDKLKSGDLNFKPEFKPKTTKVVSTTESKVIKSYQKFFESWKNNK